MTRTGLPQMLGGMFCNSKIAQRLGKQSLSVLDPGVRLSAHAMALSCRVVGKGQFPTPCAKTLYPNLNMLLPASWRTRHRPPSRLDDDDGRMRALFTSCHTAWLDLASGSASLIHRVNLPQSRGSQSTALFFDGAKLPAGSCYAEQ